MTLSTVVISAVFNAAYFPSHWLPSSAVMRTISSLIQISASLLCTLFLLFIFFIQCMEEDLEIRQKNSDPKGPPYTPILIPPNTTHPWHKSDQYSGTKVQFRSASSEWSCGCVDVNELGTSVLLLPQRGWFRGSANRGAVTAHVEVRGSEKEEERGREGRGIFFR